jgi:hypothetical protein
MSMSSMSRCKAVRAGHGRCCSRQRPLPDSSGRLQRGSLIRWLKAWARIERRCGAIDDQLNPQPASADTPTQICRSARSTVVLEVFAEILTRSSSSFGQ